MLKMMESAFTADFNRRIPTTLQPTSVEITEVRDNMSTSFSTTDYRVVTLKIEVQMPKNQLVSLYKVYIVYTERLDQLVKTKFEISTTVSDLSLSLNAFIDDAKKMKVIVRC